MDDRSSTNASPARPRRMTRLVLRGSFFTLVAGGALLTYVFRHAWFTDNFGVVEPGKVFRMSQPKTNIPALIREKNLASVLNLRGGSMTDPWYADEVQATKDLGVDFYDLPMSASRRPRRQELLALIEVLDHCRYPLLIHCKSGSDRTGLATALYLLLQKQQSPKTALQAFTVSYGHFPLGSSQTLHEPIDEYAAWLSQQKLEHSPQRFEGWVKNVYKSDEPFAPRPPVAIGPRVRAQALHQRGEAAPKR